MEQSRGTLHGVIVQFGGQTPLKLAERPSGGGKTSRFLGTSPDMIDLAEDRDRFKALLDATGPDASPTTASPARPKKPAAIADEIGYPVVIRPSYVLGGGAMEIVRDTRQLERYISEAVVVSGDSPVLIDSYLADAIEVDVDALSDGKLTSLSAEPWSISRKRAFIQVTAPARFRRIRSAPTLLPACGHRPKRWRGRSMSAGLMNVQYAVKDGEVFVS